MPNDKARALTQYADLGLRIFIKRFTLLCVFSDTGDEYMDIQGIPYGIAWDLWLNLVALWGFTILFLILTYVQLRRMKKYK